MKQVIEIALSAPPVKGELSLAQPIALAAGEMKPDRAAGIIRNVPVIAVGPAKGHGFEIDQKTLTTLMAAVKLNPNIKSRLTHPERAGKDGATCLVGRPRKLRIAPGGDRVLCDIHIGEYAKSSPLGDMHRYLFDLAEGDPSIIGLSIVAGFDFEVERNEAKDTEKYLARVLWIRAIDFTDNPAANREGLLSAQGEEENSVKNAKGKEMNAKQRALLVKLGLDPKATMKQAREYALSIDGAQKAKFDALARPDGEDDLDAGDDAGAGDGDGDDAGTALDAGGDDDDDNGDGEALDAGGEDDGEAAPAKPKKKVKVLKGGEQTLSAKARKAERERIAQLTALSQRHEMDEEWLSEHIENETPLAEAMLDALDKIAEKRKPPVPRRNAVITGGEDGRDTVVQGLTDALCLQAGAKVEKPHARHEQFVELPLAQQFAVYLGAIGVDTRRLNPKKTWEILTGGEMALFRQGLGERALSHGSSDFPGILANVQNKILMEGYDEEPSTWQEWAAEMEVKDFKPARMITAGGVPKPPKVVENAEYTFASFGEKYETVTIAKYGVLIQLSWEMFINDDINAFTADTFDFGGACRELEGDIVYNVITSNPTMTEDSKALFHTDHSNLSSGSAGAPTLARIDAVRVAMRRQKGVESASGKADGRKMMLRPVAVLVPETLASQTMQLFYSTVDITKTNATPNYKYVQQLAVISDPRLDDNSTSAWYTVGPKRKRPVVAAFLRGYRRPYITREAAKISNDGFVYKVRHVVGAGAGEWRAINKNAG